MAVVRPAIAVAAQLIRQTDRLESEHFDILVIGGGIIGAGVARDAAMRGFSVALIDRGDFGGGTSSRSSKLIHGGLRYLEHGEFRLVREACAERAILLKIAPDLVRPLPLIFPHFRGAGRPLWKIRLGLLLYDFIAGRQILQKHQMLSAGEISKRIPNINPGELEGGGIYFDCAMNDARLCLENILDAGDRGVAAANYVLATALTKSNGRVDGIEALDLESGKELRVRARAVINAAGPWVDSFRWLDDPNVPAAVRTTRGVHLITRRLTDGCGIAFDARSDGRLLFVLPFGERHSLIGTTDTDSKEDPAAPQIRREDVEYLLSETNALLPGEALTERDITGVFAGLRTLLAGNGKPGAASREYKIEESQSGLISVIGGKYTTYRAMAAKAVERAAGIIGRDPGPCPTAVEMRPHPVMSAGDEPGDNEEIFGGSEVKWAGLVHGLKHEMVRRPMDFLRRRTALALIHPADTNVLGRMRGYFEKHIGWDRKKAEREMETARAEWNRHHCF